MAWSWPSGAAFSCGSCPGLAGMTTPAYSQLVWDCPCLRLTTHLWPGAPVVLQPCLCLPMHHWSGPLAHRQTSWPGLSLFFSPQLHLAILGLYLTLVRLNRTSPHPDLCAWLEPKPASSPWMFHGDAELRSKTQKKPEMPKYRGGCRNITDYTTWRPEVSRSFIQRWVSWPSCLSESNSISRLVNESVQRSSLRHRVGLTLSSRQSSQSLQLPPSNTLPSVATGWVAFFVGSLHAVTLIGRVKVF